ncbi:MAG TPA: DNA polymerase I, partial [Clostridiales bacterium]|nr:DNA polymerase I [Clostridiales bacterium]
AQEIPSENDILGTGKKRLSFKDLDEDRKKSYIYNYIKTVLRAEKQITDEIRNLGMEELYRSIELPLIDVLAYMEFVGFKVDMNVIAGLGIHFQEKIALLEKEIYEKAGENFNINSPKQLAVILFEKLGLTVIKKTKTGISTDAEVLDRLKSEHEIVEMIIEYRQMVKLNSTYVEGLKSVVGETGRVHSSFNQTIAATGRISSTEPNLQNIPTRTEEGRELRKAFVADDGYVLCDADYSQIELRVLAHLADEKNLIEAFENNEDIHTKTASQVFHVSIDEVTSEMRSRAKAVNFGIVYGISDYGLSRDLNIPRKESKQYIENYLSYFSSIDKYMKEIVEHGKEDGYVTTYFGRRRNIPELASRNFNIRSFGERVALNTPVQGTAADIIKAAMVGVYKRLKNNKMNSKLILQVHDELIIEAYEPELEDVKKILKEEMENVVDSFKVKLKSDVNVGRSWYDAK